MLERDYKAGLIRRIRRLIPQCIVVKIADDCIQGFPDLLILYGDRWAALEVKRRPNSARQPNQEYYVEFLDGWSFASFIDPSTERTVLDALRQALQSGRTPRVSQPKQLSLD